MQEIEFVSFEVTKLVLEHFSYKFDEELSNSDGVVFINFKEPFRHGMKQITLDAPNIVTELGQPGYRHEKLVHIISYIQGFASLGEAIAIIKMTIDKLH